MTTRPLDVSSGPLAPPSRLSRLGALSLATRTLALRWRARASLRPGLAPLLALLARALLASALLLLLARLPARTPERWRWKPAAASARVYSGALALIVPFLILSALAAVRPRRLIAPPKTHEIEIVGLGEAVRERGASRREGRKRMDDSEGGKGAAGSEGGKGADSSGSHSWGSDALEQGDEEEDAASPVFSASASAALDLLASLASDSGGAETAAWIRAAAKIPGALPPTAALAIIRELPRPTRRKPARTSTSGEFIDGHEGGSPPEGGSGTTAGGWADSPGPPAGRRRYRRRRRRRDSDEDEEGEEEEGEEDSDTSSDATASSDSDSDSDADSDSRSGSHADSDSRRSPPWAATVRCARGEPVAFATFRTERGVPRDALGPPARRAANLPWLGDVRAWFARCPETLEVRVCEALDVGGGGAASGAFANDRADRDAFARAVAKFAAADANATVAVRVASDEARDGGGGSRGGTGGGSAAKNKKKKTNDGGWSPSPSPSPWRAADATVVAIPAGDPAPFLKSALAGAGAHAVPADHESNLLALAPGGVFSPGQDVVAPSRGSGSGSGSGSAAPWDGRACGKDARRRREYKRRARKFARRGGEVVEADPRDAVEWARDLRWAAPRTALEEAKEKAALLGGGGGGGGDDDDARGGEEGERERDEEEDDDRDDEPPGDESGAFALVSEDSRRASRRVGVDERARVAASLAASLASARRAEEDEANFVSPLFLSATNGNGNAAPRAEAEASGGWRALEARVRDPSSGACTRVGAALFRLPAPVSSSVSSSSPAAPRRACVRAAWLSPSAEAKRLSTFAALLRGVVRAAARSECAVVDLGPGGDAEKRRLGAEARRGTWMTTFADAALAAPTRAAGRGELYEGLLRAARPSGDPNAREEGVEGDDFGFGAAAGNDSRGAKNGSRGVETDSAGRSNVANTPNPNRLSKAAASAAFASAPAASRREARRSRRREARDRRKMARVASRAFAAARAKAMAERAAGGTRDAATADGDAFVDAEEGAEA